MQGPLQGGGRPRPARKGGQRHSQGQQPTREASAARKDTCLQPGARKVGRLQGARKGLPPAASPAASRGGGTGRRGGRPLVGWLPGGKGSCRLRRGSSGDGCDTDGARGVRASF
ncbi:hypothetical protein GW17_00057404 [Ensete ventricosum]|nr:hypothetical protein GW17_00057404 [Ensete ventricosum]